MASVMARTLPALLRQLPEHPATDELRALAATLRVNAPQPQEKRSAGRAELSRY